jgi:tetratricopeptide (TPR) repeat protein
MITEKEVNDKLLEGILLHQAGELAKAEEVYRAVLEKAPAHPDALHAYGVLMQQAGKLELAGECIAKAISINPEKSQYNNDYGNILRILQRDDEAIEQYKRALELGNNNHVIYYNLGEIYYNKSMFSEAIIHFKKLLEFLPENSEALNCMGACLLEEKRYEEARECLVKGLELELASQQESIDCDEISMDAGGAWGPEISSHILSPIAQNLYIVHNALAVANFSEGGYCSILGQIHKRLLPNTYLEIGVRKGTSLALAEPSTIAIGVDPYPDIENEFAAITQIYKKTSDEFFADNDIAEALEGNPLDLAFIDGLHVFEQVLKDFINVERCSTSKTIIMLHDCLPLNAETSSRVRQTIFWSGDTWKIIPCLKKYRPDLEIFTIETFPTGLAVVGNLDPDSKVLEENYEEIVSSFINMNFIEDKNVMAEELNVVAEDWEIIWEKISALRS